MLEEVNSGHLRLLVGCCLKLISQYVDPINRSEANRNEAHNYIRQSTGVELKSSGPTSKTNYPKDYQIITDILELQLPG